MPIGRTLRGTGTAAADRPRLTGPIYTGAAELRGGRSEPPCALCGVVQWQRRPALDRETEVRVLPPQLIAPQPAGVTVLVSDWRELTSIPSCASSASRSNRHR